MCIFLNHKPGSMKKTILFLGTTGILTCMACGHTADEVVAQKARRASDSIREDSLSRADAEKMMNDMAGDTVKKDSVPIAK